MGHYPALVLLTYVDESYTDDAARPSSYVKEGPPAIGTVSWPAS
jgi:hypothetical protein